MKKGLTLRDLGEDRSVDALVAGLPEDAAVQVGPGDDCAVIGGDDDPLWQLLKTDCVLEGRHFASDTAPQSVGWKAMARVISDFAAMGGLPKHALVTLAIAPDRELAYAKGLYDGLAKVADAFGVAIVGGETASSPGPLFLSIAMTGTVEPDRCVLRSGGQPGDVLFVTGRLGGSLKSGRHLRFTPRVREARWLTEHFEVHAMMDLSDGLGADLPRLARASHVGFEIEGNGIPCNRGVSMDEAISDGEDYELLFAIPPEGARNLQDRWATHFPELRLSRIGRLMSVEHSSTMELPGGYDHFN
jgi:thiamine-monophosphate kinase